MKNILEYLEDSASKYPEKIAFSNVEKSLAFKDLIIGAAAIGSFISENINCLNNPIIVITDQSPENITAMLGVTYSGNFYVPVDCDCPEERLNLMLETLSPSAIIAKDTQKLESVLADDTIPLISFEQAVSYKINEKFLKCIRDNMVDTDPLFAIFTSGSTGVPKCIVKSHCSMISFIEAFTEMFEIDETTIFGNQSPFYFDASTKDIYSTLKCGAQTVIVPKSFFMFPSQAINLLNEKKVNTIVWVPSVLATVSVFNVFEEIKPEYLTKVFFVGEVMPVKHLNYWINNLEGVVFINLYGTTEAAGNCLYHIITEPQDPDKPLPLGKPFSNAKVFLLNGNQVDDYGEICISGPTIALGYYNNLDAPERFCQNPVHANYYERICRTGDYARLNNGVYEFVSRVDFQIKHMGNRIELGDIESSALAVDGVDTCCCVYDKERDRIVLYFTSCTLVSSQLKKELKQKLPAYMLPNKIIQLDSLPFNANGKIDRKSLLEKTTIQRR